ncbi:jg25563 [Pararge aegeria aegeria]|uniref:Jg25563 protein n=1 Tax=Pararge aegeria aegeria TaxID=348720 RepID=A0A8S4RYE3_9NEOP|nr:jg25563 [Pararge aegeria aegeria]
MRISVEEPSVVVCEAEVPKSWAQALQTGGWTCKEYVLQYAALCPSTSGVGVKRQNHHHLNQLPQPIATAGFRSFVGSSKIHGSVLLVSSGSQRLVYVRRLVGRVLSVSCSYDGKLLRQRRPPDMNRSLQQCCLAAEISMAVVLYFSGLALSQKKERQSKDSGWRKSGHSKIIQATYAINFENLKLTKLYVTIIVT